MAEQSEERREIRPPAKVDVLFGTELQRRITVKSAACAQYIETLSRLYPGAGYAWPNPEQFFQEMEENEDLIRAFIVLDGQIVSTGEVLLMRANPNWQAVIGNMATRKEYGHRGLGGAILQALIGQVNVRWAQGYGRKITLTLTNSPRKENSAFYTDRGWVDIETKVYILPSP